MSEHRGRRLDQRALLKIYAASKSESSKKGDVQSAPVYQLKSFEDFWNRSPRGPDDIGKVRTAEQNEMRLQLLEKFDGVKKIFDDTWITFDAAFMQDKGTISQIGKLIFNSLQEKFILPVEKYITDFLQVNSAQKKSSTIVKRERCSEILEGIRREYQIIITNCNVLEKSFPYSQEKNEQKEAVLGYTEAVRNAAELCHKLAVSFQIPPSGGFGGVLETFVIE